VPLPALSAVVLVDVTAPSFFAETKGHFLAFSVLAFPKKQLYQRTKEEHRHLLSSPRLRRR
jgi:hypothetical protein